MDKISASLKEDYCRYLAANGLEADKWTTNEIMAIATARQIPDGSFLFVGTGLPLAASMLAQYTTAPKLTMISEAGIIGPKVNHIPISIIDPRLALKAEMLGTISDVFGLISLRGFCTHGILGAGQCDKYGNINSTIIGDNYWPAGVSPTQKGPQTRLTGSGGANSIASVADEVIVIMIHEKRRLPEKVDYLTTVSGQRGPGKENRFHYGLYRGGKVTVCTDFCIMKSDPETGILILDKVYPGVSIEAIKKHTGWELDTSRATTLDPPTEEELMTLRMVVDPGRLYLGRKSKRREF
ncbi:MAG: CoA-transferase subunit beta [Syntrophomonadaceae bacterium]